MPVRSCPIHRAVYSSSTCPFCEAEWRARHLEENEALLPPILVDFDPPPPGPDYVSPDYASTDETPDPPFGDGGGFDGAGSSGGF